MFGVDSEGPGNDTDESVISVMGKKNVSDFDRDRDYAGLPVDPWIYRRLNIK